MAAADRNAIDLPFDVGCGRLSLFLRRVVRNARPWMLGASPTSMADIYAT